MNNRKIKYDILKFIGTICIILAHIHPPIVLFQLRNFDVVLMIMISASLFFEKYNEPFKKRELIMYIKKRFTRLIIPTWIFLTIYFLIIRIVFKDSINLNLLLSSYSLHNGIGYVWVIRIYIIESILLPLLYYLKRIINFKHIVFLTFIIYVIYEILCTFNLFNYNIILSDYIAYLFPLFVIILITYILNKKILVDKNIKQAFVISFINIIIFIILFLYYYKTTGSIHNTNYRKYPFRLYYLSYAIAISTFLLYIVSSKKIKNCILLNKFFIFIGKSSLWIYLWHILFLKLFSLININWLINYVCITIFSFLITLIQNKILDYIEKNTNKEYYFLKMFRG